MKRRAFCKSLLSASAAAAGGVFLPGNSLGRSGEGRRILNPYRHVNWETWGVFKGNMHMHTLQSDGWYPVPDVVDMYKQAGYSILSITDHDWNYPNFRVDREPDLEYRRSPYPKDPKPANFPANPTWPWTDYGCASPEELGMVGIQGNELTFRHHICSYFTKYGVWYERTGREAPYGGIVDEHGNEVWEHDQLEAITRKGGLSVLCHPSVLQHHGWWIRQSLDWYVEHYARHPKESLVGIEVTNTAPDRRDYDEGLWDQLLARFMPQRPIWGFGADDNHRRERHRQTFNLFYLPECTDATVRSAMERGQFCFTKSTNHTVGLLDQDRFPSLKQIAVDEQAATLTLTAADCDEIKWITSPDILEPLEDYRESNAPYDLGKVVHTGPELDYRLPELRGYVRAELSRTDERGTHTLMTNPFGITDA